MKEKRSKASKEVQNRPEVKAKRSISSKEMWKSEEYRNKFSTSLKATLSTPEQKERMSLRSKAMWEDPEYRDKMHLERLKQWQDPEFRRLMSESSSKRMTETLRRLQVESDRPAILYIIGFRDNINLEYCVKVGITVDSWSRFHSYTDMSYEFIKGYMVEGSLGEMSDLENKIHNSDFVRFNMDKRKSRFLANGYTEWYTKDQLYKIRDFVKDSGYEIRDLDKSQFEY